MQHSEFVNNNRGKLAFASAVTLAAGIDASLGGGPLKGIAAAAGAAGGIAALWLLLAGARRFDAWPASWKGGALAVAIIGVAVQIWLVSGAARVWLLLQPLLALAAVVLIFKCISLALHASTPKPGEKEPRNG